MGWNYHIMIPTAALRCAALLRYEGEKVRVRVYGMASEARREAVREWLERILDVIALMAFGLNWLSWAACLVTSRRTYTLQTTEESSRERERASKSERSEISTLKHISAASSFLPTS